ncbi:hypothetical protein PR048_027271 [Dryococelus australis]|uniref:Uncharacterized protein n=1 Tax=Dryococelus australis TaxID=614101 RepID=A0ABQ9GEZ9_9NEOP|nr:hypothetical protein PR048_027271 [Dryococelus australis]
MCRRWLLISDRDFESPKLAVRNVRHLDLQYSSELERLDSTVYEQICRHQLHIGCCCHSGRRRLDQHSLGSVKYRRPGNVAYSSGNKLDSTVVCVLEPQEVVHWLTLHFNPRPDGTDKIDFKRVYTDVTFAIGLEFIRHTLSNSAPIVDLQGDKKRIPQCQMWITLGLWNYFPSIIERGVVARAADGLIISSAEWKEHGAPLKRRRSHELMSCEHSGSSAGQDGTTLDVPAAIAVVTPRADSPPRHNFCKINNFLYYDKKNAHAHQHGVCFDFIDCKSDRFHGRREAVSPFEMAREPARRKMLGCRPVSQNGSGLSGGGVTFGELVIYLAGAGPYAGKGDRGDRLPEFIGRRKFDSVAGALDNLVTPGCLKVGFSAGTKSTWAAEPGLQVSDHPLFLVSGRCSTGARHQPSRLLGRGTHRRDRQSSSKPKMRSGVAEGVWGRGRKQAGTICPPLTDQHHVRLMPNLTLDTCIHRSLLFTGRSGQYQLGSPLVDDRPIMNAVKYRVVSGVVWINRTMMSSNTDANRTGADAGSQMAVVSLKSQRSSEQDYFRITSASHSSPGQLMCASGGVSGRDAASLTITTLNEQLMLLFARAAVAERLACSPPTRSIRAQSPAGSPDFHMWESCRTMPLTARVSEVFMDASTPVFYLNSDSKKSKVTSNFSEDLVKLYFEVRLFPAGEIIPLLNKEGVSNPEVGASFARRHDKGEAGRCPLPPRLVALAADNDPSPGIITLTRPLQPSQHTGPPPSCWRPPLLPRACAITIVSSAPYVSYAYDNLNCQNLAILYETDNSSVPTRCQSPSSMKQPNVQWGEGDLEVLKHAKCSEPHCWILRAADCGCVMNGIGMQRTLEASLASAFILVQRPSHHHWYVPDVSKTETGLFWWMGRGWLLGQLLPAFTHSVTILPSARKSEMEHLCIYATPVDDVGTLHESIVAGCETIRNLPGIRQRNWVSMQQ